LDTARRSVAEYCLQEWTKTKYYHPEDIIIITPSAVKSSTTPEGQSTTPEEQSTMPTTKGSKMPKTDRADKQEKKKGTTKETVGGKNGESMKKPATNEVSDHCVDCGKAVLKTQQGLTCDGCGFWHHCECEDVSDEIYEFLCDNCDDDSQIAWYCKNVRSSVRNSQACCFRCMNNSTTWKTRWKKE